MAASADFLPALIVGKIALRLLLKKFHRKACCSIVRTFPAIHNVLKIIRAGNFFH
jgi:hypothetical protein